jgi:hypothetical protein
MKYVQREHVAQLHIRDANYWHFRGDEFRMYRSLFMAAMIRWTPPASQRQIEQRKLASQLRTITGCIGSLHNLQRAHGWNYYINRARADLVSVEDTLRQQMATIKERIPNE